MSESENDKLMKLMPRDGVEYESQVGVTLTITAIPGPSGTVVAIYIFDGARWLFFPFSNRASADEFALMLAKATNDVFGPAVVQ